MSDLAESDLVKSKYVTLRDGRHVYKEGTEEEFVYRGKPITNKTSCKRHGVALTCSMWRNLDYMIRGRSLHEGKELRIYYGSPDYPKLWDSAGTEAETRRGLHTGVWQNRTVHLYKPGAELAALIADWPYWHRAEMCLDQQQIDPDEIVGETVAPPRIPEMEGANENPKLNPVICGSCDESTIKLTKGQLRCLVGVTKACAKEQGVASFDSFNRVAMCSLLRKGYIVASIELSATGKPTFGVKPTHDAAMHAVLSGEY